MRKLFIVIDMQNDFADASCCAGMTPEKRLAALEAMRSCQTTIG